MPASDRAGYFARFGSVFARKCGTSGDEGAIEGTAWRGWCAARAIRNAAVGSSASLLPCRPRGAPHRRVASHARYGAREGVLGHPREQALPTTAFVTGRAAPQRPARRTARLDLPRSHHGRYVRAGCNPRRRPAARLWRFPRRPVNRAAQRSGGGRLIGLPERSARRALDRDATRRAAPLCGGPNGSRSHALGLRV